jgi:hypothetical protein
MTASSPVLPAESAGVTSLLKVLQKIPDPRNPSGRRHPLEALLGLLLISFMTGKQTVKDAVLMGQLNPKLREPLGFTHAKSPSQSTYSHLFTAFQGAAG